MKHFHLDDFAKKDSFFHNLDPRAKIVAVLGFIFLVTGIESPVILIGAALLWLVMLISAGIPLSYILSRTAWLIPFAGVMIAVFPFIKPGVVVWEISFWGLTITATREGILQAGILFARVFASIMGVLFLTSTTRFHYLLKGLAQLRVPGIMLQLLEFTVRYIFVALDELKRMRRARKARAFKAGKGIWDLRTLKTLGLLVGALFIRAYERGERVYLAMLSRGYKGSMKTLHEFRLQPRDYLWAFSVIILGVILVVLDWKGM